MSQPDLEVDVVVEARDRRRGTCTRPRGIPEMSARLAEATEHDRHVPTDAVSGKQLLAKLWGRPPGDCDRLGRPREAA